MIYCDGGGGGGGGGGAAGIEAKMEMEPGDQGQIINRILRGFFWAAAPKRTMSCIYRTWGISVPEELGLEGFGWLQRA